MATDNWGPLYVTAHTPDDLITPYTPLDNGRTVSHLIATTAEGDQLLDTMGSGSFTIPLLDRDANPLLSAGRIIRVYVHSLVAGKNLEVGTFIINRVEIDEPDDPDTIPMLVISGPDMMRELQRRVVKQPIIGNKTTGLVTIAGSDYYQLDTAASGVDDTYNGGVVLFDSGGSGVIADYTGSTKRIYIEDGTWSGAAASTGDTYTIYLGKASDDLDQAISHAPTGWSISSSGTTAGTTVTIGSESVYDLLREIAEQSGEHFRLSDLYPPTRALTWVSSSSYGDITDLVQVTATNSGTFASDLTKAPIISCSRDANWAGAITRAYVTGGAGGNSITLRNLTSGDVTIPAGWAVDFDQSLIVNSPAESGLHESQRVETQLNISHIVPESDSTEARTHAKIELFNTAVERMAGADPRVWVYSVKTVLQGEVRPGHKIDMNYTRTSESGETLWSVSDTLYVHKVHHSVGEDGVRWTELELRDSLDVPKMGTEAGLLGSMQSAISKGAGWAGDPTFSVGGSNPIVIPVQDHGGLTGLGDDDHPIYVPADGSRALTGNLAADPGVTIDGVDISVHVSLDNAHHEPASGGDGVDVTGAGQVVSLDRQTDSGLEISGGQVGLGTPDTIQAGGAGGVSGDTHGHPVQSTSDGETNPDQLLQTNSSGVVRVRGLGVGTAGAVDRLDLDGDLKFIGAQEINTTAGDLGLAPAGNLILYPAGESVEIGAGAVDPILKSDHWVSGLMGTGWGLSHDGHLDARSGYFEELYVSVFTLDQARVRTGELLLTPSGSVLAQDLTLPAVTATTTIYVEDAPGLPGIPVFAQYDYVRVQLFEWGTGLNIANVLGNIYNYTDQGDGTQSWTFYTIDLGTAPAGAVVKAGGAVIDWGQKGDGWVRLNAIDRAGSPYIQLGRWTGSTPHDTTGIENPIRLGDLGGVTGDRGLMGLFVGAPDEPHVVISEHSMEAHGMAFSLYRNTSASSGLLKMAAAELVVDYGAGTTQLRPNADVTVGSDDQGKAWTDGLTYSTGSTGYTLIDDDPDTPTTTDWVSNAAGEPAVATFQLGDMTASYSQTEQITIKAYVTITPGNSNMKLVAQVESSTGGALTTSAVICDDDDSSGLFTRYLRPLADLTEADWDGAYLRFHWYVSAAGIEQEAIRLDPTVPSIAVGATLPTGTNTGGDGFWAGLGTGGLAKMRIGGTPTSGKGSLVWDGTSLILRDGSGNDAITLEDDGDSYFTGLMTIITGGSIVAGETLLDDAGLAIGSYAYGGSPNDDQKLKFISGVTEVAAIKSSYHSTSGYKTLTMEAGSNYLTLSSLDGVTLSSDDTLYLITPTSRGVSIVADNGVAMNGGLSVGSSSDYAPDGCGQFSGGVIIGSTDAVYGTLSQGQILLDQGANDDAAIYLMSSDVVTGLVSAGLWNTNTYGSIYKASSGLGGLNITGLSESVKAVNIEAHQSASNTHTSTSANGAINVDGILSASSSMATTANVFVVKNNGAAKFVVKGNGNYHYDGTGSAYDHFDDVSLLRLAERELGPEGIVESVWDEYLAHNREELIQAGVVNEEGWVNGAAMMKLQNGAIWQLHQRLSELERRE